MLSFKTQPALLSPPLDIWFEAPWLYKANGTYFLSYMCSEPGWVGLRLDLHVLRAGMGGEGGRVDE